MPDFLQCYKESKSSEDLGSILSSASLLWDVEQSRLLLTLMRACQVGSFEAGLQCSMVLHHHLGAWILVVIFPTCEEKRGTLHAQKS